MNISQISDYSATASPLNYKYQEQELQESGFYSFKWRNYMPDVGRFFNVDPLSEKYAYQSHYNFSENRVINSREIEGLEARDNHERPRFEDRGYDGGIDYTNNLETGITSIDLSWTVQDQSFRAYIGVENIMDYGSGRAVNNDGRCIRGCHDPGGAQPESNISFRNENENLFNFSGGNNTPDFDDRFRQGGASVERSDLFEILSMIYSRSGNNSVKVAPWVQRLMDLSDAGDKAANFKEKFLDDEKSNDTLITIDWSHDINPSPYVVKPRDTFLQMTVKKNEEGNYQYHTSKEIKEKADALNKQNFDAFNK